MKAMILKENQSLLVEETVPIPTPKDREILIKVEACGVCRTDLHIRDKELIPPKFPIILGHEIVGRVEKSLGAKFKKGQRVGVPWLHFACGQCEFCKKGLENLCEKALFTGFHKNGGFAEYTTCPEDFAIDLSSKLSSEMIAPLLCAGLVGYRAYQKAGDGKKLGFFGFGASAHILTQIAVKEGKEVYAFTKEEDAASQEFAKSLGAIWAGSEKDAPPCLLDATILFAPVGRHIPASLKILKKAGRCITAGIYMSPIPTFGYEDLWGEKRIESVANLTRKDAAEFFEKLKELSVTSNVTTYPLEKANEALDALKAGSLQGAAVLVI